MTETAAQVLLRCAIRWNKIKHLNKEDRKRLMRLSEDEFRLEIDKLTKLVA